MEPQFNIQSVIVKSDYFQAHLEKLLSYLQPSFFCLDLIVKVLLDGPDGSGKRLFAKRAAESLNMSFCEENVADMFDENIVGTEKRVKTAIARLRSSAPCIIYLSDYELFCKLDDTDLDRIESCIRETLEEHLTNDNHSQPIVFIAATNDFDQVYKSPLSHSFHHNMSITPPNMEEAERLIKLVHDELELTSIASPKKLLDGCKNLEYYLGNLVDLISHAELKFASNIDSTSKEEEDKEEEGTRWLDIGGLGCVKQEIIDTIQFSLDFPQLKKSNLRRKGVLLHGPPGTGKTLLAKAVATECNLNFINVKGPELLNEYVGQSEDNVRKLFQKARDSSPSVVFFDEIDSIAPNRGQAGDSGGVMDRMVSQLLAEMDGIGKDGDVFVIGATNRVDLVDQSLLRPGRFDKILEVPIPTSRENRIEILKALTRKMNLNNDVDLNMIERKARPQMSGADFQSLCSSALHKTMDRCVSELEAGKGNEEDIEIVTTMNDFLASLGKV